MTLIEVKSNLIKIFPNNEEQIEEYVDGINDYDCEEAYNNITLDGLKEDFELFLTFYTGGLDT